MSSYNATVELFSKLCFAQLSQPLSALDAANDGFGATLVPYCHSGPRLRAPAAMQSNV
jgi:hypothetical protein